MNNRWIIVFDWETDSPDPHTCNPVELAAIPIEPRTLEIKKDKAFNTVIKPPGFNKEEYFTDDRQKTIEWHAKQRGVTSEDIIKMWKKGKSEKIAWKNFCEYCKKFHIEKSYGNWYTEPIAAGYNIIGFDLPICQRLSDKHKTGMPFAKVNKMDIMDLLFYWFENLDEPKNMRLDTMREFFSLKTAQAHEAYSDTLDTAKLLVQFLQFHRRQARVGKFKGAMEEK
tara:strand:- start:326 stop:1000 length:675 start_codon:yes stop_codon:yes gene_type:complete